MHINSTSAVVTGAASGLGAATAMALAHRGARVFGLDLPDSVASAPALDGVELLAADITDEAQVSAALDRVGQSPDPLRIVVNCAGICPSQRIVGRRGPHDLALFAKVLAVNVLGTFTVMALAGARMAQVPALEDGERGVIVNTASIAAFDGQTGQAAYAASKGGVVALTLPAARDLASSGIRVNAIAPGTMRTPMLDGVAEGVVAGLAAEVPFPPRLGRPHEFAHLVLAVIENGYMNGETIRMDGALRMKA